MLAVGRLRSSVLFILKILILAVVILALCRPSMPRLKPSPDAVKTFHQKIDLLKRSHDEKSHTVVRISAIELNSFYAALPVNCGSVWPPPNTVFYFSGQDAGFRYAEYDQPSIRGHVTLLVHGTTVDTKSVVVWLGILPVPASAIRRLLRSGPLDMEKQWAFPEFVGEARIDNSQLVLTAK